MKSNWLVVILVVVALVVAVLIVWFFLQPKPTAQVIPFNTNPFSDAVETGTANTVSSPAVFAMNFYKWYIGNREANANFPSTSNLASSFTQWMTPSLILQYQSTIDDPNNDADPILFAQDDPAGWGPGMTATILNQNDTTSSVRVIIGLGSLAHTYTIGLVKGNGQWLINTISGTY